MPQSLRTFGITFAGLMAYLVAFAMYRGWYQEWAVYTLAENAQILRALGYPVGNAVDLPAFETVVRVGAYLPSAVLLVALPFVISLMAKIRLSTAGRSFILFTHASFISFFLG